MTDYESDFARDWMLPPGARSQRVPVLDLRETWLNMCDEASAPGFTRLDFDPTHMEMADRFSREYMLPKFDIVADIDKAYMILEEHELHCDNCGERMTIGRDQAEVVLIGDARNRHFLVHAECMTPDMSLA